MNQHTRSSHLFTVRVWQEDLGRGQREWRGKLQHVLGGEARYFRDWAALVATLQQMLLEDQADNGMPAKVEERNEEIK